MHHINLNGKITMREEAGLPVDNRAFRYGYGLFETMLVRNGAIQLADLHADRLMNGVVKLGFSIPKHFNFATLVEQVLRTVRRNDLETLCRVRLQVFAGSGGLMDDVSMQPQYLIECYPLEESVTQLNENGLVLGFAEGIQKSSDSLANLKTSNALVYAVAARQAKQNKWNDVLVCNTAGNVIESTIANLFWVKDEKVYTPPLTDGCIDGVMRKWLIHKLNDNGITITEQSITPAELLESDEVFLTNAIRKVKWVGRIEDRYYSHNLISSIADIF